MVKVLFDRLSFLVVDDNGYARQIVRAILGSFGAREVIEAEDGASALEMIERHRPKVVVTDLIMPVLDGFDMVRTIRGSSTAYAQLPIIMITAHAEKKYVLQARALGVSEFLRKPFSPTALYQRVQSAVARTYGQEYETAPCEIRSDAENGSRKSGQAGKSAAPEAWHI